MNPIWTTIILTENSNILGTKTEQFHNINPIWTTIILTENSNILETKAEQSFMTTYESNLNNYYLENSNILILVALHSIWSPFKRCPLDVRVY
jgi:hypothetical protein